MTVAGSRHTRSRITGLSTCRGRLDCEHPTIVTKNELPNGKAAYQAEASQQGNCHDAASSVSARLASCRSTVGQAYEFDGHTRRKEQYPSSQVGAPRRRWHRDGSRWPNIRVSGADRLSSQSTDSKKKKHGSWHHKRNAEIGEDCVSCHGRFATSHSPESTSCDTPRAENSMTGMP